MSNLPQNIDSESTIPARRGKVDSVDLYEVKEHELEILENGGNDSIYLNFSIFLISIAISCLASLCTSTFNFKIVETIFIVVTVLGFMVGLFLLLLWTRQENSVKKVIKTIRKRIESSPVADHSASVNAPVSLDSTRPQ